jgi:hypothetical protein
MRRWLGIIFVICLFVALCGCVAEVRSDGYRHGYYHEYPQYRHYYYDYDYPHSSSFYFQYRAH